MLTAAPTFTQATAPGNVLASQTLAAAASVTSSTFFVGVAGQSGAQGTTTTGSAVSGHLQIWDTFITAVAATAGCQVQVFSSADGSNFDTVALGGTNFVLATSSTLAQIGAIDLPPGVYKLKLTNLDATNAITIEASLGTTA